jgi:hypothetical protein
VHFPFVVPRVAIQTAIERDYKLVAPRLCALPQYTPLQPKEGNIRRKVLFVLCLPDWNEPLNFDAESRSLLVRGFLVTPYYAKRAEVEKQPSH